MSIIQGKLKAVPAQHQVGLRGHGFYFPNVEMLPGVDGDYSRAIPLKFVGVQRIGRGAAYVGFEIGRVECALVRITCSRQRIDIVKIDDSAPGNELSAGAAYGSPDDDSAFRRGNVGKLVPIWAARGVAVRIGSRRGSSVRVRRAIALQSVLDGKEVVGIVGFRGDVAVVQIQHERVAALRQISLRVNFLVFAGVE